MIYILLLSNRYGSQQALAFISDDEQTAEDKAKRYYRSLPEVGQDKFEYDQENSSFLGWTKVI